MTPRQSAIALGVVVCVVAVALGFVKYRGLWETAKVPAPALLTNATAPVGDAESGAAPANPEVSGEFLKQVLSAARTSATDLSTPPPQVAGSVRSKTGLLISGAKIYRGPYSSERLLLTTTDSSGTFNAPLADGEFLMVVHGDYAQSIGQVAANRADVVLSPGGVVRGTVYLNDQPVSGAKVTVMDAVHDSKMATVPTGADGTYVVPNVPEGELSVFAEPPPNSKAATIRHFAEVVEGVETVVDLRLSTALARVEGRVTVDGEPPRSFVASGWLTSADGMGRFFADQKDNSHFVMADIPPGLAKIRVRAVDGAGVERTQDFAVELSANQTYKLEHDFSGGSTVRGVVNGLIPNGPNNGMGMFQGHIEERGPEDLTTEEYYEFLNTMYRNVYLCETASCKFEVTNVPPGDYTFIAYAIPTESREAAAFRNGRFKWLYITVEEGKDIDVVIDLD